MNLYHRWNTGKKSLFWSVLILLLLILVLFVVGIILQQSLPKKIKEKVTQESHGVYQLEFEHIRLNLLTGGVRFSEIRLMPDTVAYKKMDSLRQPPQLFEIASDVVSISGMQLIRYLFTGNIVVGAITIDKPKVINWTMREEPDEAADEKSSLIDRLPEQLINSRVKKINIHQLSYQGLSTLDSTKNTGTLKNISLEVVDLDLDTSRRNDSLRCWFAKDIRLYGKQIHYRTVDAMYDLKITKLEVSTEHREIGVDSFRVIPRYPEMEFARRLKISGDRYDMIFPRIQVNDVNFKRLEALGQLPIRSLLLDSAEVRVFVDKGMPEKTTQASNNFPAFAFQRLSLPITIDSLKIKGAAIYYKERNPKSGKSGTVFFTDLTGDMLNVSNDTLRLKQNRWVKSNFTTNFLGKPKLTLALNFDMLSKDGAFNYKGSLEGAPASFYNQLFEPISLARAEEGHIQDVYFDVKANRYQAQVYTLMRYNDLKVAVLDAESGQLEKKGFLSLFVNWVAVKSNNPSREGEPPREAKLVYEHPQERTFFNLMWKAIYEGFKINLGLPKV
ncbi:hypothetical protein H8S90_03605 [Olivibacter sp. SDN3]|uniref:hypothetical protein n=1 Tax=Olivibacter sp. SDN3 TaxID=2764720 RepID=UPI001651AE21|nr:hypothetical protein [Olivibacter sp. SDN3]QNL50695.1 hypothetical protein H8S90_03605 [Olivibacter sp. SDN3]